MDTRFDCKKRPSLKHFNKKVTKQATLANGT